MTAPFRIPTVRTLSALESRALGVLFINTAVTVYADSLRHARRKLDDRDRARRLHLDYPR